MSKAIRIIHYDEQAVGRRIKSTKKHYTWKFAIESSIYTVELFSSRFSGKRTLKINDEIKFEGKKEGKIYHKSIEIGDHSIIVLEVGKGYDLRIDGVSFQILQKQAVFAVNHSENDGAMMSSKLIPEQVQDWEKQAKPFDIFRREVTNLTTREVLPIVPKRPKTRVIVSKPAYDPRIIFATNSKSPCEDMLTIEEFQPKPRAYSSYNRSLIADNQYD